MKKLIHKQEIAVEVLMESQMIQKWVQGELKAYGLDSGSPEGKVFIEKQSRMHAEKLIR